MTMPVPASNVEVQILPRCPECDHCCFFNMRSDTPSIFRDSKYEQGLSVFGDNLEGQCPNCNTIIYMNLRDIFKSDEEDFDDEEIDEEEVRECMEALQDESPPSDEKDRIETITINITRGDGDKGKIYTSEVHFSEKMVKLLQHNPELHDAVNDQHLKVISEFKRKGFTVFYINGVIGDEVRWDEKFLSVGHIIDINSEDSPCVCDQYILYNISVAPIIPQYDEEYPYGYMYTNADTTEILLYDSYNIFQMHLVFYQEPPVNLVDAKTGVDRDITLNNFYGFYKKY